MRTTEEMIHKTIELFCEQSKGQFTVEMIEETPILKHEIKNWVYFTELDERVKALEEQIGGRVSSEKILKEQKHFERYPKLKVMEEK